jgi:hypothetical protein
MLVCRSILILNNARIHWNDELIQMCDAVEIILARLFSYSSDFNLIETSFALLKAWIKRNEELIKSYTTEYSLAVGLGFGQKFKPDPRVDVRPGWTDQSSQSDPRVDVRRVLPSLSETSYI